MRRTVSFRIALIGIIFLFLFAAHGWSAEVSRVSFAVRDEHRDALLCRPEGAGPFPIVVFNHGSIVDGLGVLGASNRGYKLM